MADEAIYNKPQDKMIKFHPIYFASSIDSIESAKQKRKHKMIGKHTSLNFSNSLKLPKSPKSPKTLKLLKSLRLFVAIAPLVFLFGGCSGWGWFVPYSLQPSYWEAQKLANIQDYKGFKYHPEKEEVYSKMLSYFGYKNLDELFEVEPRVYQNKEGIIFADYFLSKEYNNRIIIYFSIDFFPTKEHKKPKREDIKYLEWSILMV